MHLKRIVCAWVRSIVQIEDSLSGIRVVKSFGNEKREIEKFRKGNERFVDSKRVTYRYMAGYHAGMDAFTTLITVTALVSGAVFLASGNLSATDLVTFLLYINNFTEPVTKLVNFTEQFQNGYSGYDRFLEMMSIVPDIEMHRMLCLWNMWMEIFVLRMYHSIMKTIMRRCFLM